MRWLRRQLQVLCPSGGAAPARSISARPRTPGAAGRPLPEDTWIEPIPDRSVLPADGDDPAELAAQRDSIRLAFVAALQHLPPRQRAVLILREVLCRKAAEVAELLGSTVVAVNSACSAPAARWRPAVSPRQRGCGRWTAPSRNCWPRYTAAFERCDVDGLVALLHEDATMSMPPLG
jgi:RNA polymerase sigma-70 factor, ECF subfamily